MRLLVGTQPLGRILKWAQRALVACAVLLLGYCGFALGDAWVFQWRESRDLDRLLRVERLASKGTAQAKSFVSPKGLIGRVEIPRLFFSQVVVEGIDRTTLRRVIGHIPGTALPGQAGNVGLAGHRDALFRPLKDLRINDEIQFSTPNGHFRYKVESLRVVDPDDVAVLAPSAVKALTMVTCYPFYYVGPAPKRWVVRARQVSAQTLVRSGVE